jgi:hypothetical protein
MNAHVRSLLKRGTGAAAELPAKRPNHKAFVSVHPNPKGGFIAVAYEISEDTIRQLQDRWESNEDFLDRKSGQVDDLDGLEDLLRDWGIDPEALVPAWDVDLP